MTQARAVSNCLILEPLPLVAHDVALTLGETLACQPMIARSEAEALSKLAALPADFPLKLAVLRMTPDSFSASPLRTAVEGRGARVILMGSGTSAEPGTSRPWALLDWPFGTDQLLALIDGLGLRCRAG